MVSIETRRDDSAATIFHPSSREFRSNPYPTYAALRDSPGLYYYPPWDMYLAARHLDVKQIASSESFVRQAPSEAIMGDDPGNSCIRKEVGAFPEMPYFNRYVASNLLEQDGAKHRRLRNVVFPLLTPKSIQFLEERVGDIASQQMQSVLPRRKMDLLADLAVPASVAVIGELLGVPASLQGHLRQWSDKISQAYEPDGDGLQEAEGAAASFSQMIIDLLNARSTTGGKGLISQLGSRIGPDLEDGQLSFDECVSMCMFLLNAGHEATVNALGNGVWALLNHPDQLGDLRQGRVSLPLAVEEILRFDAPLQLFHRFAACDTEIAGSSLRRGAKVGLLYGSANRDERVFDRPNRFDISRRSVNHFAFGVGEHLCLGMHLARLELRKLLEILLEQIVSFSTPLETAEFRDSVVFRGLTELPVEW